MAKKILTELEIEAIREHWRQVAFRELVPASLRILERATANGCELGCGTEVNGQENNDDEVLLQYQRELPNLRPIAEEVLKVLQACRGKVGKTISQKEFEALLEEARRRGRRRAGKVVDEDEAPKAPKSEPI